MTLTYDSITNELRRLVPGFERLYEDHLEQYDELLPHVLMGDLVRHLLDIARAQGPRSTTVRTVLEVLEEGMNAGDLKLHELISASFLENLERTDPSYLPIRAVMGPKLIAQLEQFENSRHPL